MNLSYDVVITYLRPILIALALSLAAITPPASAQEKGGEAHQRGDYAAALREWRPLAEQGLDAAQYNLGFMYANGRGVPEDHAEAVRWYRKAAEQGHAGAQHILGNM
jgi:uncharacterized protein